jgi:hypothetical protein
MVAWLQPLVAVSNEWQPVPVPVHAPEQSMSRVLCRVTPSDVQSGFGYDLLCAGPVCHDAVTAVVSCMMHVQLAMTDEIMPLCSEHGMCVGSRCSVHAGTAPAFTKLNHHVHSATCTTLNVFFLQEAGCHIDSQHSGRLDTRQHFF